MSVLSFMAKRLRDGGRRKRTTVRKPPRPRLALEALDDRILLSVTEFPIPTADSNPVGITRGPDGNLWFTETQANKIGRITPAGVNSSSSGGRAKKDEVVVGTGRGVDFKGRCLTVARRLQARPPQPVARRNRLEWDDLEPVPWPDWFAALRFVPSHRMRPPDESEFVNTSPSIVGRLDLAPQLPATLRPAKLGRLVTVVS
jgi:hypothetical protein